MRMRNNRRARPRRPLPSFDEMLFTARPFLCLLQTLPRLPPLPPLVHHYSSFSSVFFTPVPGRYSRLLLRLPPSAQSCTYRTRAVRRRRKKCHSSKFTATEHRSWMLRLAHENSYLSWSRNAAICAGVGATIVIVEMQFSIPMADYYAVGFTDLGLVFLTFGSIQHLYSAYRLRKLLQLSMVGSIWIITYTSFFALIYYALVQSKFKILPPSDFEEET